MHERSDARGRGSRRKTVLHSSGAGIALLVLLVTFTAASAVDGLSGARFAPFLWNPVGWVDASVMVVRQSADTGLSNPNDDAFDPSETSSRSGESAGGDAALPGSRGSPTPALSPSVTPANSVPTPVAPAVTPSPIPDPSPEWVPDPEADPPHFTALSPEPFSTTLSGTVRIDATAISGNRITRLTLSLNGEDLDVVAETPAPNTSMVLAQVTLEPGVYTVTASVHDDLGRTFQARWDFLVSFDVDEGMWFDASGVPKPDAINQTIRWLVETSRWHLSGETTNMEEFADLPTHAESKSDAEPLGLWVSSDGFDSEYTEATLKSLVEAHRWHLWGIAWPGEPSPDLPTHADAIHDPRDIGAWFTAAGDPIQENIKETLRRLVEISRWHYWGYSWDGNRHFEQFPTHANDE